MEPKGKEYLKWGIGGIGALVAAYFLTPILATIAWNMVSLGIAGITLAAMWFLTPPLLEFLANSAWSLKELVWRTNPVPKLWRDLHDFGKEIQEVNVNIDTVASEASHAKSTLKAERHNFDAEEILSWEEDIAGIDSALQYMINERDNLLVEFAEMEKICKKMESHWKMGNAMNRAATAVSKAQGISGGTEGGRVSIDEIQRRLATGRARLDVLKTRKTVKDIKAMRATDVTAKPLPAIENKPSSAFVPPMSMPAPAIPVAKKDKVEDLLSKI